MTIKELYDQIEAFSEEQRKEHVTVLFKMLTPLSMNQIMNFQNKWDGKRTYEEFKSYQAHLIRQCIEMEIHFIGKMARANFKLPPLTWETNLSLSSLLTEPDCKT